MTEKLKFVIIKVITRLFIAEVIHKKEILLFWIASLHFVRLAMTGKILSLRGFVKTKVIQNVWCAFLITMWLQP
ncbi:hypothetical protein, partial [Brachyspira catarrhinii]|uniref:hypothetical protein n=1 Tax=Brachyspira catarrhinii TaxID=2528966 RepID=UPI00138767E4